MEYLTPGTSGTDARIGVKEPNLEGIVELAFSGIALVSNAGHGIGDDHVEEASPGSRSDSHLLGEVDSLAVGHDVRHLDLKVCHLVDRSQEIGMVVVVEGTRERCDTRHGDDSLTEAVGTH